MGEKSYLRAHLRMDVMILLQYRELTPKESETIENPNLNASEDKNSLQSFSLQPFIEGKEKEDPGEDIDPFIINALIDINLKLNLILRTLSGEGGTNIVTKKPMEVSLSEGGIGFTTNEKMKLEMLLPVFPIAIIKVWGRVVRAVPLPEGGYKIGVQYINIKEEDQNKIVHYIFQKQRALLRTQKGQQG
jgi:hypothetical protein